MSNARLEPDALVDLFRASPFRKTSYDVGFDMSYFVKGFTSFTQCDDCDIDRIFDCVPLFQRTNDKWTREMQIAFVENVLQGYRTQIMLYEVCSNGRSPLRAFCKLIDGYQRLTAIISFIRGDFTCFGYTFKEMDEQRILVRTKPQIGIKIYSFESEQQAVEFYIAINENITHSTSDIQKARNYLERINTGEIVVTDEDFLGGMIDTY